MCCFVQSMLLGSLSRLDKCLAGYVDDDMGRRGYCIHG